MGALAQLDWREPAWWLLGLVPLALAALARPRRQRLGAYAEAALLPWAVAAVGSLGGTPWRRAGEWLAWLLLALAAAGPRLPLEEAAVPGAAPAARHLMELMLVLDVSASMSATDVAPDRLTRARLELDDLLKRLRGERLGLVVYAGRAGLLLPPTDDIALVAAALEQAGPDLIDTPGTNLAAALDLARVSLMPNAAHSRGVLLVSDGEADSLAGSAGETAREAVGRLKAARIPLYILGVGGTSGAFIPLPDGGYLERDGAAVVSRMAAGPYEELAVLGGGRFVPVADGDGDWSTLYDHDIARLPGDPVTAARIRAWRELYPWCLVPALLLFMVAGLPRLRSAGAPSLIAIGLALLALHPGGEARAADAADAAERSAWQAWHSGRYGEALNRYVRLGSYSSHLGAGAAAWRLRDYAAAAHHFEAALMLARAPKERIDALYDLGNAHYGLGHWQAAVEAYRAVLAARPGDVAAAANLAEAEHQWQKQRRRAPMRSDLRGRRGSLAEGEVNLDWDSDAAPEEFEPQPAQPLIDRGGPVAAASLNGAPSRARRQEADARRLQSGLKKMELLEDRPRELLRGMMKQDTPADARSAESAPW